MKKLKTRSFKLLFLILPLLFGGIISYLLIVNHQQKASLPHFSRQLFGPWKYQGKLTNLNLTASFGTSPEKARIEVSRNNSSLEFALPLKNPELKKEKEELVYTVPEKYFEVKYKLLNNGLKEEIVLNKKPESNELKSELNLKNLKVKLTPEGIPVFFDSQTDEYQFHFQKPFAKDAKGNITYGIKISLLPVYQNTLSPLPASPTVNPFETKIKDRVKKQLLGEARAAEVQMDKYQLVLTLNKDWLFSSQRVYPITIDPTVVHDTSSEFAAGTLNRVKDTGSGSSPNLETYYQELPADIHTVGLWHMNETSGTNVSDSSGNTNTGTATNTEDGDWTTAKLNNGLNLDGSNEYVTRAYDADFNFGTSSFTVEGWFKHPTISAVDYFVSRYDSDQGFKIWMDASGDMCFGIDDDSTWEPDDSACTSAIDYDDNNWHYVAGVKDGATAIWLYVDGIEVASDISLVATATLTSDSAVLRFGSDAPTAGSYWEGMIDEIRISNIARTPEEIKLDAQRRPYSVYTSDVIDLTNVISWNSLSWIETGVQTGDGETLYSSTNLVAQWNFNETSGTTAADSSGNGNTGTLVNMTTSGQDAAAGDGWTTNNRRWGVGALMFDGTDGHVTFANGLSVKTIETWINPRAIASINVLQLTSTATITTDASGKVTAGAGFTSPTIYVNGSSSNLYLTTGQWQHIVVTTDTTVTTSTGYLGRVGTSYFGGVMDSTRIYSRALTASEILANYQAGNIEFQTRVGASSNPDDGTWEAWAPAGVGGSESQIDSMDTSAEKWGVDSYQNSSSTISKISGIDTGTGADDDCIINNGTKIIDSDAGSTVCNSSARSTAYAVNFSDTTLELAGETSVTVSTTPTGLLAGDEILIINLQGTSTNYNGVGQYETHIISSISTNDLNFTDYPLRNSYDGTTQKIMVQRVPNFGAVTVCGGNTGGGCTAAATLTATAWNGTKNGVLFFRSNGTVSVNSGGIISTTGLGYRGGAIAANSTVAYQGEGIGGVGAQSTAANLNGGGGAGALGGSYNDGGGGGGYGKPGTMGKGYSASGGYVTPAGNAAGVNLLSSLYFGGGGGGGSCDDCEGGASTPGSNGGGIIAISANTVTVSGSIVSKGNTTSDSYANGGGGSGAGGSTLIFAILPTVGTNLIDNSYGAAGTQSPTCCSPGTAAGGNGSVGRIAIYYTSSLSGSTTPVAYTNKFQSQVKAEGTGAMQIALGAPQVDSATVGLWHMDETGGTGAYIKDASGNNHGTPTGTSVVDGFFGKARSFNGSSDYIDFGASTTLAIGSAKTISIWFKWDGSTEVYNALVERTITSGEYVYSVSLTSAGKIAYYEYNNGSQVSLDGVGTTMVVGNWYNLVVTWDGSNQRSYINGVLDVTEAATYSTWTPGAGITQIGRSKYGSNRKWDGVIDEVKIDNVARSAEEIAEAYRVGRDHRISRTFTATDLSAKTKLPFYVASDRLGTNMEATIGESAYANYEPDANTTALWHLEEQTGTANTYIKDSSSYGNNSTTISGTTFVQGKIGKARSFSSNYIDCGTGNPLSGNSGTLEAWIYPTSVSSGNGYIVVKGSDVLVNSYGIQISNATAALMVTTYTPTWAATGNVLAANNWYHLVGVIDGQNMKVYLNGQLVTTNTFPGTLTTSSNSLWIGEQNRASYYYPFPGIIDEVRISNITRTPDDIRQAYEVGLRTHPITIDFKASIGTGTTASSALSFTVDETTYGSYNKASHIYLGDKIILKEKVGATEYLAQGTISAVNSSTGAVSVAAWDSGSTFPTAGFTSSATVFKWQREYFDVTGSLSTHRDAITRITTRITDASQGSNVWLDDFRSGGPYITNPLGSIINSPIGNRYFQYRSIFSSWDRNISPSLSAVTLDYVSNTVPNTPTNSSPANGATGQSLTPTLTSSAFSDPDPGDTHLASQWQITATSGNYSSPVYDSGTDTTNKTSITVPGGNLSACTTYYWHVRHQDNQSAWSGYSTETSFKTNCQPNTPSIENNKYFDNAKINDTTPTFNFKSTDSESDDLGYEIQVDDDNLFGSLNLVAESSTSSGFLNTENGADTHPFTQNQTISYTVQSALTNGTTYWYRLRSRDPSGSNTWSSWSTKRSLTIDTSLSRDELFQTTKEQFDTDTKSSVLTHADGYVYVSGTQIDNADTAANWVSSDATNFAISQETTIKHEGTGSVKAVSSTGCWGISGSCDAGCTKSSQTPATVYTSCGASGTCEIGGDWKYNGNACDNNIYVQLYEPVDCAGTTYYHAYSSCSSDGSGVCYYTSESTSPGTFCSQKPAPYTTCYNYISGCEGPNFPATTSAPNSCSWVPNTYTNYVASGPTTKYTGSGTCDAGGSGNCYKLTNGTSYYTGTTCNSMCPTATYYDSATCSWITPLNATATLTKATTDLSSYSSITFWVRSSRTGSYLRFQMGESASSEQTYDFTINSADTWEQKTWDISGISSSARDAITKFAYKVTNADSGFTLYFDDIQANSSGGSITSTAVYYAGFAGAQHWQYLSWNDDETTGDIKYQAYYDVSGTPTIIPDSDLQANSAGFGTSPLDISGLRIDRYPIIYVKATLTYSGGSPKLNDWTVSAYQLQEPFLCNVAEASGGGGPLNITWEDKSTDEYQFRIEKSTDAGAFSLLTNPAANSTSYSDSAVSNSHTYQYRIRGETSAGDPTTSWCTTAVINLGVGNFKFEGVKMEGVKIN